jgi:hypothetical protein
MPLDWLIYRVLIDKFEFLRLAQDGKMAFRRGPRFTLNLTNRPDFPSLLSYLSG